MCVTTDITDLFDIHPKNKQDVGARLALWALANSYGKKELDYSGPLYESMKAEGGKIKLTFHHAEKLRSSDGQPLSFFEVAGDDGNFVEAKAEIDGDTVIVSSDAVAKPSAVRFGWKDYATPNLVNGAGLPASPFRTDDFKLKTAGRR
jgi:sialate O-acetylesterase